MPKPAMVQYTCPSCGISHSVDMSDASPGEGEYDGLCDVCEIFWEYASILNAG